MKVQTIKNQIRLQEWASQINAQRRSGMKVREWCEAAGIGYKNFYYRLRRVQEELLEALEGRDVKSKTLGLVAVNENQLPGKKNLR